MGGEGSTQNPKLIGNFSFYSPGGPTTALKLGLSGSNCQSPTVTNNYIANNVTVFCNSMTVTGNTFYGSIQGFTPSQFPSNTYFSSRPTGVKVFIRPNQYEAGRANITVFNWAAQSTVSVDLSGVLTPGQGFEIRNGQDVLGAPVVTGTYDGSPIALPMNLTPAAPIGWPTPSNSGPDFNVFLLLPASAGGSPSPTPTRTPTGAVSTPTRTPTVAASTPTPTPTPGGAIFTVRIEAESPVLTAPMVSVSDSTAFGGKYIVTSTANSGTGSWAFSVPSSGTYYVWCRVQAPTSEKDSFFVKMDSGAEDVYDVAWGNWSSIWQWNRLNGRGGTNVSLTLNPRTFSLSAGTHTLVFRGREPQARVDRVIITNSASFVPTETP